jgi:hypothetical protein
MNITWRWLALCGLLTAGTAAAQSAESSMSLEQAISQVQQETGGKVLSAGTVRHGRGSEHRIKVLTPNGHVRVILISSEAGKAPAATETTKSPAGSGPGNKEKH